MINKIKFRFITLAMIALFILLGGIITSMNVINFNSIVLDADFKLEMLAQNKGRFPKSYVNKRSYHRFRMTSETPYELRYFSVLLAENGEPVYADTRQIKAIDQEAAIQYAGKAMKSRDGQGFIGNFRFTVSQEESKIRIVFLDCGRDLFTFRKFLISSIVIALGGYLTFFFVILYFSNRIVKPVTESYEKQKRFITDAGHEIKTPLTIVKADVDVLEMEYGENEWLDGIKVQVKRLADLTEDLIYLSRMEEPKSDLQMLEFPFSDVVSETAQAFYALAQTEDKTFECHIEPMLSLFGNEKAIRQLVNILMDNAMKYSPAGGLVSLSLNRQGRHLCLSVMNTTKDPVEEKNLSRIFDRFYRMDDSRSSENGGYGIGLSVAKAIVTAHNGKISAVSQDRNSLQILVRFSL